MAKDNETTEVKAEVQVVRKPTHRSLPCKFTDEEKRDFARELAQAIGDREGSESEKKRVDAQLKADIERHTETAADRARKLRVGHEYRDVECEDQFDYNDLIVRTIRLDTGERVGERVMTTDERQTGFAFKETPG
jgi:hypothetical protein